MGWNNMIGIVSWHVDGGRSFMDLRTSVNRYTKSQKQHKYYRGVWNDLTLQSSLTEDMLSFDRTEFLFKAFKMDYGAKARYALSAGGFYKLMDDLVYYKYAQSLFSGGMATWEEDVDLGKGTSYGTELMHEYVGKNLHTMVSYTWSKTNRYGFPDINEGGEFHARFDRRHVLNAVAQWKGFSAAVNLHDVNVGVCNATNHFNPFMLHFDAATEGWKMIALLPILPNFSYRISF